MIEIIARALLALLLLGNIVAAFMSHGQVLPRRTYDAYMHVTMTVIVVILIAAAGGFW